MKRTCPLLLAFAAAISPATATMNSTINPLASPMAAGTATGGNLISLEDPQALVTARGNLSTAAVLSGENTPDGALITLPNELAGGGALFTLTGPARWSRNDTGSPAVSSGARFGFVTVSENWTIGTAVPGTGATHFGVVIRSRATSPGLVTVTAKFSDGSSEVYANTTGVITDLEFAGFAAPAGTTITGIEFREPAGGNFMQFDDVTIIVNPPVAGGTWTGAGADGKWSAGANWESGAPPAAGDSLAFRGALNLNTVNDLAAGRVFTGFTFLPGAGAFTLTGNAFSPGAYLANSSASTQTIATPLELSQDLETTVSGAPIVLNGVVSGDFGLKKLGAQKLTLNAADTFTGPLALSEGSVDISGDHSAAQGDILLSNTLATTLNIAAAGKVDIGEAATLRLGTTTNGTATARVNVAGTLSGAGTLIVSRGSTLAVTGTMIPAGSLKIEAVGGYGATLLVSPGGRLEYQGQAPLAMISGVNDAGRARLTVDGGTFTTTQPVSATGTAFPARLALTNGGILRLSADFADPGDLLPAEMEVLLSAGDGVFDTNGHDSTFTASLGGKGTLVKTGSGTLSSTGAHTWEGGLRVEKGTFALTGIVPWDHTAISVADGATLRLDFQDTDTVGTLALNGQLQVPGIWGAPGSGAEHTDPRLGGNGKIRVTGLSHPDISLTILPAGTPGNVTVTWDYGTLESSPDFITWIPLPAAVSPLTEAVSGRKFFRVRP
ncbi:MAG: hypothetical protein V4726_20945 [Verrucomicrobiota bacterium]